MREAGLTPALCRAARAITGWSQDVLAEKARVSRATLVEFEKGTRVPHQNNLEMIRQAFEGEGMAFGTKEGRASIDFLDGAL